MKATSSTHGRKICKKLNYMKQLDFLFCLFQQNNTSFFNEKKEEKSLKICKTANNCHSLLSNNMQLLYTRLQHSIIDLELINKTWKPVSFAC